MVRVQVDPNNAHVFATSLKRRSPQINPSLAQLALGRLDTGSGSTISGHLAASQVCGFATRRALPHVAGRLRPETPHSQHWGANTRAWSHPATHPPPPLYVRNLPPVLTWGLA
jgi:hypothetical protein